MIELEPLTLGEEIAAMFASLWGRVNWDDVETAILAHAERRKQRDRAHRQTEARRAYMREQNRAYYHRRKRDPEAHAAYLLNLRDYKRRRRQEPGYREREAATNRKAYRKKMGAAA